MKPSEMYNEVKRTGKNWWMFLILGIAAIAIGGWLLYDKITAAALTTYLFAGYFLVSGIIDFIYVIVYRKDIPAWGWPLTAAILMIFFGLFLVCAPYFAAGLMTFVFAFGIIFMGINFIASIALIEGVLGKVLIVILGIMVIVSGAFCITNPLSGLLTVATIEALSMFFGGVSCIILAIELSRLNSIRKKYEASMKNA